MIDPVENDILLDNAAHTLNQALELLRMITPEGWDRAYSHAVVNRTLADWHTADTKLLADARLLALRGGPRFRDLEYSRVY